MQNRRLYSRYLIEGDAKVGTINGEIYKAEIVDLSEEGAKLELYDIPDLNQG